MKFVEIEEIETEGRLLIIPSCGYGNVDQLITDMICFNFCKHVGRLISDNIDFVASQNPFDPESKVLASTIDVYAGDLPTFGPVLVLRVAANLPASKRRILDYARELCEYGETAKVSGIVMIRSVASSFCIDEQLRDWPSAIRGFGDVCGKLNIKPIEKYPGQDMLKAMVFGELFECMSRVSPSLQAVFVFSSEDTAIDKAVLLARVISGKEDVKVPFSW